ncbi:hypothetical protein DSM104299_01681 [Baekduia alba]|nr:hypothetical protein DSM104299_01681 [Baekduia alba]
MTLLLGVLMLGSVAWVAKDASERNWSGNTFADASWKWVLGVLLLWFVALPLYFVHRRRVPLLGAGGSDPFDTPERPSSVPPPGSR